MSVVLFDFDGTLVRGDSIAFYLRNHLFGRGAVRRGIALLALPVVAPFFLWWRSAWVGAGFYVWLGTVGRGEDALRATREAWLDGGRGAREKLLIAPALAAMNEHIARGERVIVVTGAETGLARALWAALDGPDVEFVGSSMRRRFGGRVPIDHCIGPRKLVALARLGLHPPFIAMYSDSALDLPLLRASKRAVMVEPKEKHLARVQRELPDVEVMR